VVALVIRQRRLVRHVRPGRKRGIRSLNPREIERTMARWGGRWCVTLLSDETCSLLA
jgi:hypothetical protein